MPFFFFSFKNQEGLMSHANIAGAIIISNTSRFEEFIVVVRWRRTLIEIPIGPT